MAGQLKGLAAFALANGLGGRPLTVAIGNTRRCMVAEMAPNRMAAGNVPQLRFICDGYCGIPAAKPSKNCRGVDRSQMAAATRPAGLIGAGQQTLPTPYRAGAGAAMIGGGAPQFALPAPTGLVGVP